MTIFEKFLLSSCMTRGCFIPMEIFVSSYFGFVTGVSLLFFKRKGSGSLSCFFLKPQIAVIERNFGHPFHGIPINFFQIHMYVLDNFFRYFNARQKVCMSSIKLSTTKKVVLYCFIIMVENEIVSTQGISFTPQCRKGQIFCKKVTT